MEEYIDEALKQEYILYIPLPLQHQQASLLRIKKGSLWPCINYHWLNQVTVKYHYPLPLVPAVLE